MAQEIIEGAHSRHPQTTHLVTEALAKELQKVGHFLAALELLVQKEANRCWTLKQTPCTVLLVILRLTRRLLSITQRLVLVQALHNDVKQFTLSHPEAELGSLYTLQSTLYTTTVLL